MATGRRDDARRRVRRRRRPRVADLGHGSRPRASGARAPVDSRFRAAHDPARPGRPSRGTDGRGQDGGDRSAGDRGGRGPGPSPRVPLGAEHRSRRGLLSGSRRAPFLPERRHAGLRARLRRGGRARTLPGVLAVVAYTTTSLAKLCSEAIEGIEPGPVDAITATGATRLQILRFGVLPQVLPLFLSYVLYRLETNIRAATVLGFVGAGGIGFYLQTYLRMIDYPAASTVLLVTVAMVMVVDAISSRLRARLV